MALFVRNTSQRVWLVNRMSVESIGNDHTQTIDQRDKYCSGTQQGSIADGYLSQKRKLKPGMLANAADVALGYSSGSKPISTERNHGICKKIEQQQLSISIDKTEDEVPTEAIASLVPNRSNERRALREKERSNRQSCGHFQDHSLLKQLSESAQSLVGKLGSSHARRENSHKENSGYPKPFAIAADTNSSFDKEKYRNNNNDHKTHKQAKDVVETHYRTIRLSQLNLKASTKSNMASSNDSLHRQKRRIKAGNSAQEAQARNILMVHRLIKDVCRACCIYGIRTNVLSRNQFGLVLSEMGLTSSDVTEIINELWQYILINNDATSVRNLLSVVCWIHGVTNRQLIQKALQGSAHIIFRSKQFTSGIDFPTEQQMKNAKGKLNQLYLNRLKSECLNFTERQMLRSKSEQELTFKPQLSEKTKELAQKHKLRASEVSNQLLEVKKKRKSVSQLEETKADQKASMVKSTCTKQASAQQGCGHTASQSCLPDAKLSDFEGSSKRVRLRGGYAFPKAANFEKEVVRILHARKLKSRFPLPQPAPSQPAMRLDIYIDSSNKKQKHELVFGSEEEPSEVVQRFSSRFEVSEGVRERLSELILSEYHRY